MGGEVTRKMETYGNAIGKWGYYKTILLSLFTFKRPTLKITLDNKEITSKIITVVIGNGISFGGGYRIAYDAKLDDGKFFCAIIGDVSILTYLLNIPLLIRGKKIKHPKIHYFHSSAIRLENISDRPCFIEMDGEPSHTCPATFTCLRSKINFLIVR
jgi:diacylglycerol kinase (ATP)